MIFLQIAGQVGDVVGGLAGRILTGIGGILLVIVIGSVVLGAFFGVRYYRSFNIFVEIQSARSGGLETGIQVADYRDYIVKSIERGGNRLIYDKAKLKK